MKRGFASMMATALLAALLAQAACTDSMNHNTMSNSNANANNANAATAKSSPAASASPTQSSAEAEKELSQIERDWADAYVRADADAVGNYISDDAVLTDPAGMVMTRSDLVNAVRSGDLKFQSLEVSDTKTRVYGESAVITYRSKSKGTYKGQDISGEERWTDVFVRRNGKWVCVASHGSSVAKQPPGKKS